MFIRDLEGLPEFTAGDHTRLKELFNPQKDPLELRYSLAQARLNPGKTSLLHRLKTSEVYYIISGTGEMEINGEKSVVGPGQAVYIPPGASQRIRNIGGDELVFICIVDPAWKPEDEEVLGQGRTS